MRAAEGDLEGARRLLESVHDKRHPNARVLVQLASCYIASGDLTDATDFLEQADKLTGGKRDGSAEKVAAAIERRKKLLAQKLEPLDIAVAQDPKDAQARAARAEVLLGAGQWEKARTDAEAAVENGSGRAKAIAYRILALAGPKPLSEILAGFDRAVEADPTFALALADRANFKAATRDKTAREDAERLAAMTAPDAVALSRASHAFLTLGDAEAASKLLARALEVDPRCVDALRTSAQLKAERGDRVGAAADLRAIVASDPDAADAQELENRAAFLERK